MSFLRVPVHSVAIARAISLALVAVMLASLSAEPARAGAEGVVNQQAPVVGPGADLLEKLFPGAAGVFLAEVGSIGRHDARPQDGPLYLSIPLRVLKLTGRGIDELSITLAPGMQLLPARERMARRPPSPAPLFEIRTGDLVEGRKYWFVTASPWFNGSLYPNGLLGVWSEHDPRMAPLLERAVTENAYRWLPQLDGSTGLTFGVLADANWSWHFRAWNGVRLIWERSLQSVEGGQSLSEWHVFGATQVGLDCRTVMSDTAAIASAELLTALDATNAFRLPPNTYFVRNLLDARSGRTAGQRVRSNSAGDIECAYREVDPATGRVLYDRVDDQYDRSHPELGLNSNAPWLRRVERHYDPTSGRLVRESVSVSGRTGWVKVNHRLGMAVGPVGATHARQQ